ncbi:hypothetical protein ACIQMR_14370 [Streptomyces sp. NPDC091376]|uniref:hypothetical protein n=1 Tax=Streptomyces sp. NPDC091376 TaxID=3365994 RepID=UPI00382A24B4
MVPSEAERLRGAQERAHEAERVLTDAELAEAVRTAARAAEILADREQVRQLEEAEWARRGEPEVGAVPAVEISGREFEM